MNTTPTDLASPDSDNEAAMRLVLQFRMVFGAVRSHFRKVEQATGLGGAQVWALSVIGHQPGIELNQLASILKVRPTVANGILKALQKRGLVEVNKLLAESSVRQLTLTAPGQRMLSQIPEPHPGVLPNALSKLPPDTAARLEQDLSTLIQLLAADSQAAGTPLSEL